MRLESYLARQVEARPDADAVVLGDDRWTFAQLSDQSARLADLLVASGLRPGDRVCLVSPRTPGLIAAMLGVLRAGGVYVPLDPASPVERLSRMLSAADSRWIVCDQSVPPSVRRLFGDPEFAARHRLVWLGVGDPGVDPSVLGFGRADLAAASAAFRSSGAGPDAAHLLFTSGSTGHPKGVMVTHASVTAFVDWAVRYFGFQPGDRHSGHPPLHFDLSTFDIFGAFASGATLFLVPPEASLLPTTLREFIRRNELTQWFSVPSVFNFIMQHDALEMDGFPALRRVLWCGEVLPTRTLRYWMSRLPRARFTNLYGPTEAAIASSYYTLASVPPDDRSEVPIGLACPEEELLVLDEEMQASATGVIGDLYIAGVGLSPGYWRDERKTQEAFVVPAVGPAAGRRIYRTGDLARREADGLVYFVGRADTQIKSRGYRIELGEIEAALQSIGELAESAVVAIPSEGFEGWSICCAYVAAGATAPDPAALRQSMASVLPSYMMPSRWLQCDALPRNANGKVDRPALRETFARQR